MKINIYNMLIISAIALLLSGCSTKRLTTNHYSDGYMEYRDTINGNIFITRLKNSECLPNMYNYIKTSDGTILDVSIKLNKKCELISAKAKARNGSEIIVKGKLLTKMKQDYFNYINMRKKGTDVIDQYYYSLEPAAVKCIMNGKTWTFNRNDNSIQCQEDIKETKIIWH